MRGAIHPPHNMPSMRGVQFKKSTGKILEISHIMGDFILSEIPSYFKSSSCGL